VIRDFQEHWSALAGAYIRGSKTIVLFDLQGGDMVGKY